MPDDERTRRRLGDATKSRIADLASGWSVGDEPEPGPTKHEPTPIPELTPEPDPAPPPRAKRKTQPPPPPGSVERRKLEDDILEAVPTPVPGSIMAPKSEGRPKQPTAPPPLPPMPAPKGSAPFGAKSGPTETGTVQLAGAIGTHPAPLKLASTKPARDDETDITGPPPSVPPPPPKAKPEAKPAASHDRAISDLFGREPPKEVTPRPVPRGEFEAGGVGTEVEQDKLRIAYEQSTLKRDAASALLQIPEQPQTTVRPQPVEVLLNETAQTLLRGDPTSLDSQTSKFERGDPTSLGNDPTFAQTRGDAGTLRAQAALRRKRGIGGDVRYVVTVLFGVRKARTELTTLDARQELRQQSRRRHLVTLGRAAATLDGFDHPALGPARELLAQVEDERSRHAGAVAEADSELMRVRRDRETRVKDILDESAALDKELAEVEKKLEPLQKDVAGVAKRAGELKESLRKLDIKIANTEMSQHSVAGQRERAAIQAEIVTLKADRVAVKRDEPKLAGELDALNPRIAALEAKRTEARKRKAEIEKAQGDDQRRADELLAAIGAKRKVVDRAASDAETLRDKVLFELGERLYHDRPLDLGPQLAPIDVIDVELGTGDRRLMELKEILSSVDKAKLARGIGVLLLVVAVIAFVVVLALGGI